MMPSARRRASGRLRRHSRARGAFTLSSSLPSPLAVAVPGGLRVVEAPNSRVCDAYSALDRASLCAARGTNPTELFTNVKDSSQM